MYIPYEEIFNKISGFLPEKLAKLVKQAGYNLKIRQNLKYIEKNKKNVLRLLKEKIKTQKLNVAFYVYDNNKWKAQSLYDLFEKSDKFTPYIFATKNCSNEGNMNYQCQKDVDKNYEYFKNKNMNVIKATENDEIIPFDKLPVKPDIIIYCQPWYVYKTQGPVMTSKYALTAYTPYGIPNSYSWVEYGLRFHSYVERYYIQNEFLLEHYSKNMDNNGKNLRVVGHTMLDYFYFNKDKKFEDKGYTIYAPHWSVDDSTELKWGTFLEFKDIILDFAKAHPELNWVYKPHPCLKNYLSKFMSEADINSYWKEWENIGTVYNNGDYHDIFMQSKAMISDCGTFQTEYFLTKKPFIHLKSKNPAPFIPSVRAINKTYYKAETPDELIKTLDEVLIKNNDYKKEERLKLYNELKLQDNYAAKNIYDDILATLNS